MKFINQKTLSLVTAFVFPVIVGAQTDEQKATIIRTAGENVGNALLSTHEAVNTLAAGWVNKTFTDAAALGLATSYRGSAELTLSLFREQGASSEGKVLAEGAELLAKQATALEAWIKIGDNALAPTYEKLKLATDAALFGGGGSSEESPVRTIAEALRRGLSEVSKWKPGSAQIAAITATPEAAAKLTAYSEAVYKEIPGEGSAAKEGQTEILVRGPSLEDLPGGYAQQAQHFKPGVKFYGFKYVQPGETTGMAYDGVFEVDGQWFFIPKAWRVFAQ